jgi:glycosyltransferase involved in cell wall biosynthesis
VRVLFVAHSFPRYHGDPAGSFLLRLGVALQALGVRVTAVAPAAPELPDDGQIEGVGVHRFRYAARSSETLAYTGNMAADVRRSWGARLALLGLVGAGAGAIAHAAASADLVHAHWWFPGGLSAMLPGAARGRPVVTTLHGSDVRLARDAAPARRLYGYVARRSASVTAVSRWLAARAVEMEPSVQPLVAPMPAATGLFLPEPSTAPRSGLLFVGRLNEQKGAHFLLRAMAEQSIATPLTILGAGPAEEQLRALAASLGVAARVRWHPPVAQPELAEFYRSAIGVVVPSLDEGLGLVAVEAMLCETPVIAFASGGLPDIVAHGRNGLLVPPGDVAALGRAMDSLVSGSLASMMGRTARSDTLATFAPDVVARRYLAIYESALAARRRA